MGTNVSALTWQQAQPDVAGFITMKIVGMQVMEVLVMLLVAAGIFNTLFVSVMERIREFGIMLAIGFSSASLFGLVMFESLWLGLVGLVAAAVLTAGPYYYMATTGIDLSGIFGGNAGSAAEVAGIAMPLQMHVGITAEHLAMIAGLVLLTTLLAGVLPARQAGRVVPVESIRLV